MLGGVAADIQFRFGGDVYGGGSGVTACGNLLTVLQDGKGTRNEFVASGWYIDELKRTEEGWRYHRRRVELDLDINAVVEKVK